MNRSRSLILLSLVLVVLFGSATGALGQSSGSAGSSSSSQQYCSSNGGVWLQIAIGTTRCVGGAGESPLEAYILVFYTYFVSAIGIIAAVMIMYGGYKWIIAAGNRSKIESAKTTIFSAATGLILTLTSWLILNILNPATLNTKLPNLTIATPPPSSDPQLQPLVCANGTTPFDPGTTMAAVCPQTCSATLGQEWAGSWTTVQRSISGQGTSGLCCTCRVINTPVE